MPNCEKCNINTPRRTGILFRNKKIMVCKNCAQLQQRRKIVSDAKAKILQMKKQSDRRKKQLLQKRKKINLTKKPNIKFPQAPKPQQLPHFPQAPKPYTHTKPQQLPHFPQAPKGQIRIRK